MSAKSYGQHAETALRDELQRRGYLVIRSAASKALDLVCVRPNGVPVGLECKRTHLARILYISKSKMMQEQREWMIAVSRRYDLRVFYAVQWGNNEFEFFYPDETILKAGHGVGLSFAFPFVHKVFGAEEEVLHVPPNTPPYSPPVSSTQDGCPACRSTDYAVALSGWHDCNVCGARWHRKTEDYIAPDGEPRDGGGCTD